MIRSLRYARAAARQTWHSVIEVRQHSNSETHDLTIASTVGAFSFPYQILACFVARERRAAASVIEVRLSRANSRRAFGHRGTVARARVRSSRYGPAAPRSVNEVHRWASTYRFHTFQCLGSFAVRSSRYARWSSPPTAAGYAPSNTWKFNRLPLSRFGHWGTQAGQLRWPALGLIASSMVLRHRHHSREGQCEGQGSIEFAESRPVSSLFPRWTPLWLRLPLALWLAPSSSAREALKGD